MKTIFKLYTIVIGLILPGCVTLYKPNAIHSPMLTEKNQFNSATSIGLSGCGLFNLQAAYAATDHIGILADAMYHTRKTTYENNFVQEYEKLTIASGEVGAGYFTRFDNNHNLLFQIYSGAGYGKTNDRIENTNLIIPEVNAEFVNAFIQPGLVITHKYFEIGMDIRANYVRLYNIEAYLYSEFEWWNTDLKYSPDTSLYFINLEPAVTMKAGGEKLKGILQMGVTVPTINSETYFSINTTDMLLAPLFKFSIGISYTFGKNMTNNR